MLQLIQTMEDLAELNAQIEKYRNYANTYTYVNQTFMEKIKMMERKREQLQYSLNVLAMAF